jgi:uncharacterized MAPEG superfamily protein
MTLAYWCILIAALMPFVAVGIAKSHKSFDNNNPRDWLLTREGRQKRAYQAHLNCFEAFPFFAAAVIVAHLTRAPQNIIDYLAVAFILLRVLFIYFYIADRATLRSLVCIALFFIGGTAAK